jgi:hypothetical protein
MRITGVDPNDPWDGGDGAVLASNTSTPAVSVTTTGIDRLAIWAAGSYTPSAWSTMPTGFTEHASFADASTAELAVATRTVSTATAVGSAVATGATDGKAAWVGALKAPAEGPEPGRMLVAHR